MLITLPGGPVIRGASDMAGGTEIVIRDAMVGTVNSQLW